MELKLALRRLFARPAYTALLVLIVGVGIGAATTVFSLVDQLLLRRAPFAYADRLVDVLDTNRKSGGGGSSLTPQKIVGWQAQPALFERFESYAPATFDVTGDGEPERIDGLRVSVGLFQMLGVEPRLGRSFTTGDGLPGGERTAIISEDLWRRRYGAQPDALGRAIALNEQDYTIVGVMPRRFKLLMGKEAVWVPVDLAASTGDATLTSFYGVGRLARGVIMTDAQRTADQLADRLNQASPIARSWDLSLRQKNVARVDPTTRTALLVLLGAVSFVLFITCANVANLFLSAAPLRLREMAIRSALGSGRARLIRSVLLESVLVAVAGGALGVLLANWGVQAVLAASPDRLASLATTTVEVDGRVIAVAISLTLLTGIIVGLLPALRGSRGNLEMTLRGSSPAARSSYGRAPSLLVVFEVAFSVVLLIGAALMARTMANLESIEPGFKAEGLIGLHVDLPTDRYPDVVARGAFFDGVVDRLKATPGILDVTVATGVPPSQGGFSFGPLEGEGSSARPARAIIPFNTISDSYFRTLQIPLLAGRTFTRDDDASVAIVSKGFADRVFPGMDAVGRRYRIGAGNWRTIVGIAANVEARAAGEERTDLMMYYPWVRKPAATSAATATPPQPRRRSYDWRLLIVRASDPSAALPDIKRQIWAVDSHQAIDRVALVADTYAEAFGRQRFVLRLMTVFSLIALGLTAAGIFGVLSQVVARRTREIGIRMALGARPGDVLGHVLRGGLALAALGAAVGCAAAFGLTRVLRTLLFGVSPTDPVSFAGVAILLVAVALIACWWPARSAMRVEPATALRVE
jgi:putative ABC transport system permease protein